MQSYPQTSERGADGSHGAMPDQVIEARRGYIGEAHLAPWGPRALAGVIDYLPIWLLWGLLGTHGAGAHLERCCSSRPSRSAASSYKARRVSHSVSALSGCV